MPTPSIAEHIEIQLKNLKRDIAASRSIIQENTSEERAKFIYEQIRHRIKKFVVTLFGKVPPPEEKKLRYTLSRRLHPDKIATQEPELYKLLQPIVSKKTSYKLIDCLQAEINDYEAQPINQFNFFSPSHSQSPIFVYKTQDFNFDIKNRSKLFSYSLNPFLRFLDVCQLLEMF